MDDLVKEFLAESREGLDRIDLCLTALERRPTDTDLLGEIFRAVHTIKGAAGFLAYPHLERLAHSGETLLSMLRDGTLKANAGIIDTLFQLMDRLRQIVDVIERIGREGIRADDDNTAMISTLACLLAPSEEQLAPDLLELTVQAGLEFSPVVPGSAVPDQANAVEGKAYAEVAKTPPRAQKQIKVSRYAESTVRVDVQVLDRMVHLVGELVLTRNQLLNKQTDGSKALQAAERLDSLTQELRQTVMQARMLPLAQLFQRFPRMVRDLAKACSKSVRIEFSGEETALDRSLIEAIKDPLMHTLRNAVDHGIEAECERFTSGKPQEGVIRLSVRQQDGWAIIEVRDDGAGISKDRLLARAVESGRLSGEQAASMTEREVMDLVFEAGLSTAPHVTHISGRGVGMDVVRSQVERVGGSVEVESQQGVGTVVRLRVPLTRAIVPAWIVRVGDCRL